MGELTDAEFWLLLSLDAESPLWELRMPITVVKGRQSRQTRPSLEIPEAAEALASLAARGFVEVRVRSEGVDDWDEWPLVSNDHVHAVVGDPSNWRPPSELTENETYWAAITDQGEAAYRRRSEATGGAWIE